MVKTTNEPVTIPEMMHNIWKYLGEGFTRNMSWIPCGFCYGYCYGFWRLLYHTKLQQPTNKNDSSIPTETVANYFSPVVGGTVL